MEESVACVERSDTHHGEVVGLTLAEKNLFHADEIVVLPGLVTVPQPD